MRCNRLRFVRQLNNIMARNFINLTPNERLILTLHYQNLDNKQIASKLNIKDVRTVIRVLSTAKEKDYLQKDIKRGQHV